MEADQQIPPQIDLVQVEGPMHDPNQIIARAFLRQRYPLTEEGRKLQVRTQGVLASRNPNNLVDLVRELPTIEHPHLELYETLAVPEGSGNLFGWQLANVQVTKGCSHKCDFCAAGAAAKVETMPFPAVLKIAAETKKYQAKTEEAWDLWVETFKGVSNGRTPEDFLDEYEKAVNKKGGLAQWFLYNYGDLAMGLRYSYERHPISSLSGKSGVFDASLFDKEAVFARQITNYYDSDPFDYQDSSFLHEDGSPADFGDVFAVLASPIRPIHITTAGWPRKKKLAQRAAEKVSALAKQHPSWIDYPRVSVNPYEYRARLGNSGEYLEDMKNTVGTLFAERRDHFGPASGHVLFFYEESRPDHRVFIREVVEPLKSFIKTELSGRDLWVDSNVVSRFSGPLASDGSNSDHHDVMACMPGFHIWPDGTVALQNYKWGPMGLEYHYMDVAKGTRPQPTGIKLY